jgi:CheY-like chemotaxis protein
MNSNALGGNTQRHTVLLIDDEMMVLEVGKAILERLGHTVIAAMSGEEALKQFAQHRQAIDCAVLDLTMPGMHGREIFKKLRAMSPELPIIIASGLSVEQVVSEFGDVAIEPESIIQKPYQVASLSNKLESVYKGHA